MKEFTEYLLEKGISYSYHVSYIETKYLNASLIQKALEYRLLRIEPTSYGQLRLYFPIV